VSSEEVTRQIDIDNSGDPSNSTILKVADEVLFRQVHPDLLDGNVPASSAFMPNSGDSDQLSVDRGSLTTPKASYDLYVFNGRRSGGTYGVSVGECGSLLLPCLPDPIMGSDIQQAKANPAHALVDFSALGTSQQKKAAKRLKACAISRGVLHKP
jgi:hypothetical protein